MDEQPASHPRLGQFPPAIVIPPLSSTHNLTIVFLHGRGSNARKFHGPLLESAISNASTAPKLREALPHVRFVFPTAPLARAAKYRRCAIHQWYEGTGDWEPQSRGEMRPGVELVRAVLREEVVRLGGDTRRLVLAGISQGCAMALTSLLLWEGDPLGAVVVMCGFVPLAESLLAIFEEEGRSEGDSDDQGVVFEPDDPFERCDSDDVRTPLQQAIDELRDEAEVPAACPTTAQPFPFLSTPVFMGHGTEDEKVQYQHGQQAAKLLEMMGISVDFRTYPGLGHWYSPDMLGHIVEFLHGKLDS
ncbi:putative acyl-protein thioesterase 1,2 [Dactylonectria macrodidyma]|uniref:Acyl-protein thioesterase 1,2 n=1 Tax=Dactylonectria macrodidyma TaxID=307937 RepID=A0A9P9FEV8_9HYPO|nr:putative acyl-protein thioesterase 1,2 [Dactylonectria macrodidyma]